MILKIRWIALGIGAYLVFLISTFPASTASAWFVPEGVTLIAPTGSVWSGQAAAAVMPGITATDLRWRISPAQLLLGRLSGSAEIRIAGGFASTNFSMRTGERILLEDTRISTSIAALADIVPVYDTRGEIGATFETLLLVAGWPATAIGEIRIGGLEVAPLIATGNGGRIPLGDLRASIDTTENGDIHAAITDLAGPLEIDGDLTLDRTRTYLFDGRLRARPDAAAELRQGIDLMAGEPDASGMHTLTMSGSL